MALGSWMWLAGAARISVGRAGRNLRPAMRAGHSIVTSARRVKLYVRLTSDAMNLEARYRAARPMPQGGQIVKPVALTTKYIPYFVTALTLLVLAAVPSLGAQSSSATVARPGNGVVQGRRLALARREFAITSSTDCDQPEAGPAVSAGSFFEDLRLLGDTALVAVREWRHADTATVDTTVLDRKTLRPLWSRTHFADGSSTVWEFRGRRVQWTVAQPRVVSDWVDSTIDEPAFLAGVIELLLAASPRLSRLGSEMVFPLIDLHTGPGEPSSFAVSTLTARVSGSEIVTLPSGGRVEAWVVSTDPHGWTYWIEQRKHAVIKWHVPQFESLCPTTYTIASLSP